MMVQLEKRPAHRSLIPASIQPCRYVTLWTKQIKQGENSKYMQMAQCLCLPMQPRNPNSVPYASQKKKSKKYKKYPLSKRTNEGYTKLSITYIDEITRF